MLQGIRFLAGATRFVCGTTDAQRKGPRYMDCNHRSLVLEPLEARVLLSVWTVTDTSDNILDTGSLRYAVANAGASDTITFSSSLVGPIDVTNGVLEISKPLTIQGPGSGELTIDGTSNGSNDVFRVDAGIRNVEISGLTIESGLDWAGILNENGYLTVDQCSLSGGYGIHFECDQGGSLSVSSSNLSNNMNDGDCSIIT